MLARKSIVSIVSIISVSLGLVWPVVAQDKDPAGDQAGKPAATSPAKTIDQSERKLRFATTTAQAGRARVKAARTRRIEDIRRLFAEARMDYPPAQVLLRGFKNQDRLELWARPQRQQEYVHLKDYRICMRSGDLGPKRRQGDGQVPEGFYSVTAYNPASSFLLAMLVSYPNDSDRVRKTGRSAGGNICIHGDCVTIGCIPLTDRWIEELYLICLDSSQRSANPVLVHLFPGQLGGEEWETLQRDYAKQPDLIRFWQELKPGYDRFEQTRVPARFSIGRDGTYRFAPR